MVGSEEDAWVEEGAQSTRLAHNKMEKRRNMWASATHAFDFIVQARYRLTFLAHAKYAGGQAL